MMIYMTGEIWGMLFARAWNHKYTMELLINKHTIVEDVFKFNSEFKSIMVIVLKMWSFRATFWRFISLLVHI